MNMNKQHLQFIEHTVDAISLQIHMLTHNIKYNRVTHTVALLRRLFTNVVRIQNYTQDAKDFEKKFQAILYDCQRGPTEYLADIDNDNVYINGNFKLDALRQVLIACDIETTIKQIEGATNEKVKDPRPHRG